MARRGTRRAGWFLASGHHGPSALKSDLIRGGRLAEGPGEWVEKDAFVLPLLPPKLNVDPMFASLLHCAAFLEFSGDEVVDPDSAIEAMEQVSTYLGSLEPDEVETLSTQMERIVRHAKQEKWPEDLVDFLTDFLENFGVVGDEDEED
jgi:hypothetical protein